MSSLACADLIAPLAYADVIDSFCVFADCVPMCRVKLNGEEFARGRIQKQNANGLMAGDEVLVHYGAQGLKTPCESFMDYGFVF